MGDPTPYLFLSYGNVSKSKGLDPRGVIEVYANYWCIHSTLSLFDPVSSSHSAGLLYVPLESTSLVETNETLYPSKPLECTCSENIWTYNNPTSLRSQCLIGTLENLSLPYSKQSKQKRFRALLIQNRRTIVVIFQAFGFPSKRQSHQPNSLGFDFQASWLHAGLAAKRTLAIITFFNN